jgi:hypothetical protein
MAPPAWPVPKRVVEIGQYWPHQRNLRGDKEVRLGTGHAVRVPWLTALDQPVQVLQLTGALVDPSGRAERVGAEGLVARRTNLLLLSVGVFELLTDARRGASPWGGAHRPPRRAAGLAGGAARPAGRADGAPGPENGHVLRTVMRDFFAG